LRGGEEPMSPRLAEEKLKCIRRRLDRRGCDRRRRSLGHGCLDDLDAALVELSDERFLLEPGQLVRLDDVADLGRADRAGVPARVEEPSEAVLAQQPFDGAGRQGEGGRGTTTSYRAGSHSPG